MQGGGEAGDDTGCGDIGVNGWYSPGEAMVNICVRVMGKKENSAAASLSGVDAADRNSGRFDDQGPCSRLKNDS